MKVIYYFYLKLYFVGRDRYAKQNGCRFEVSISRRHDF